MKIDLIERTVALNEKMTAKEEKKRLNTFLGSLSSYRTTKDQRNEVLIEFATLILHGSIRLYWRHNGRAPREPNLYCYAMDDNIYLLKEELSKRKHLDHEQLVDLAYSLLWNRMPFGLSGRERTERACKAYNEKLVEFEKYGQD